MSLFLGPIHHLLYGKIQFQSRFANFLIEESNNDLLKSEADKKYPAPPKGELEDIVDTTNIHGSLQVMVTAVEKRFAFVVSQILKNNIFSEDELLDLGYKFGQSETIEPCKTATEAYMLLSKRLLNGMPCDRVEQLMEKSDDLVTWRDTVDIRADHWQEQGLSSEIFYKIRSKALESAMENSDFIFSVKENGSYEIRRK